jgi:hypothetical protein
MPQETLFSKFGSAMGQERTVVTVFGGGVAGLSAAHELILRGYYVQLIEPRESNLTEYACEVGGLAASQYSRVKATRRIHPYFFSETEETSDNEVVEHEFPEWNYWDNPPFGAEYPEDLGPAIMQRGMDFDPDDEKGRRRKKELNSNGPSPEDIIKQMRALTLRPTQRLIPFADRVVFQHYDPLRNCCDKAPTEVDPDKYLPDLEDDMGTLNGQKLDLVAAKILLAIHSYWKDLNSELRALDKAFRWDTDSGKWVPRTDDHAASEHVLPRHLTPEIILRETFLLEIKGHHGTDDNNLPLIAWKRACAVKLALLDILARRLRPMKRKPPSKRQQEAAQERVKDVRYLSNLSLEDVAVAFHDSWEDLDLLHGSLATIKKHLRGFLIVMIEPSDERPPLYKDWPLARGKKLPAWFRNARLKFNRVEFAAVQHTMPGEHGYRFFPSFYKNLFSTMRRTPIMHGEHSTHRTVFDNLREPPAAELARMGGKGMQPSPKRPRGSAEQLKIVMKEAMAYLGATEKDQYKSQNRFIKYMTSSQARRRKYEDISWLEFLDGFREMEEDPDPAGAAECHTSYSPKYEELLRRLPQALVSMSAAESDARSFGSASIQNLKDFVGLSDEMDMMLNGPTSATWLHPWKEYLKTQGVRFFVGHIERLEMDGDELKPILGGPQPDEDNPRGKPRSERPGHTLITAQGRAGAMQGDTVDYFVSTLPFEVISKLLWVGHEENKIEFCGDMGKLLAFVQNQAWPYSKDYDPYDPGREASGRPRQRFEFPLRDFNGIQYYFDKNVQIGGSYVYYVDAPWGLTALAQVYLWQDRPSPDNGFLGELSVDIGTLYEPGSEPGSATAWNSAPQEIATGVWHQIHSSLPLGAQQVAPAPSFYYIDTALEFDEPGLKGIKLNCTPFIVQLPGQYRCLPGSIVSDRPDRYLHNEFIYPTSPDFDSFEAIHYNVSHKRWILAGSCMPTHTRLFTMEGANESARHAVNALLHDKLMKSGFDDGRDESDRDRGLPGTYCDVYNMEMDEFTEFNYARRLDRELMEQGLPHVLDILETFEMLDELPDKSTQMSKAEKLGMVLKSAVSVSQETAGDSALVQHLRMGEQNMDQYARLAKGLFDWIKSKSDKD